MKTKYINHPSNFQMLNASLTFMFSSITWLFWGRGASQHLSKSISCDRAKILKAAWASTRLYCGEGTVLLSVFSAEPGPRAGWS